jgi:arginyl-tRNA synthetase
MLDPQAQLTQRFAAAVAAAFGPEFADADPLIRPAQNTKFGDFQANLAMSLGKRLNKPPREVAAAVLAKLEVDDLCELPADRNQMIAGPGFINLKLRSDYLSKLATDLAAAANDGIEKVAVPQTVVVDYSGPNVAKEMHVGHLRSTVIGDAIARTLDKLGHTVIRQNHLGDWGTQFGMLIEYLLDQPTAATAEIRDLNVFYQAAKKRFDEDANFAERSRQRVVQLQGGDAATLKTWRVLVAKSTEHFDELYHRLGVLLTGADFAPESSFNDKLAPVVKELLDKHLTKLSDGATCIFMDEFKSAEGEPLPMIIQKSDGGYLYATTDLAALQYRIQEKKARRICYVTDARQKQHFAMVFKVGELAGWTAANGGTVRLDHVAFGSILGEDNKPFKTRSGETVKLVDLLDEAQKRAEEIVKAKNTELPDNWKEIARVVGIGAVKYGDLSSDRVKDYVFSWDRMLAMEGNTAPYLQYAYARIQSIFRKAAEAGGLQPIRSGAIEVAHPAERNLVLNLAQSAGVVRSVGERLEPHHLCNYLFDLATTFSSFYENCPVLKADNDAQRNSRLALADLTARTLKTGLDLLGIEVLDRM